MAGRWGQCIRSIGTKGFSSTNPHTKKKPIHTGIERFDQPYMHRAIEPHVVRERRDIANHNGNRTAQESVDWGARKLGLGIGLRNLYLHRINCISPRRQPDIRTRREGRKRIINHKQELRHARVLVMHGYVSAYTCNRFGPCCTGRRVGGGSDLVEAPAGELGIQSACGSKDTRYLPQTPANAAAGGGGAWTWGAPSRENEGDR